MTRYVVRRLSFVIPLLVGISMLTFLMVRLIPGNPVTVMLGQFATPSEVKQLDAQLGLNLPIGLQYLHYVGHLLRGNLGTSLLTGQSVAASMFVRIPITVMLAFSSLVLAVVFGVSLAVLSVFTRSAFWDAVLQIVILGTLSIPSFLMGIILILVFGLSISWLPVSGWDGIRSLILPALSLGIVFSGVVARILRGAVLSEFQADYARTARAKGAGEGRVLRAHVLRNAALPAITVTGLLLGDLLGGAIVTEAVFNLPGLGSYMVEAVLRRDFPEIQGTVLVVALAFVLTNLLVDVSYAIVDPRIRYE